MPAELVARLDRLRDAVSGRDHGEPLGFRFGHRILAVHTADAAHPALPVGALPPADPAAATVDLYVLDPDDVAALAIPADAPRAAYGALVGSPETGWLVVHDDGSDRLLAFDVERRVALYAPGAVVPPRERAEFCRPLVHWLAILDGHVVVHAGAVAAGDAGLLVAGAGNAGKSTLVRACLAAGFSILGDNVVEVVPGRSGAAARLVPIYATFKIRPGGVLPVPPDWPEPEWDPEPAKHIHFVADAVGASFAHEPVEHAATLVLDEHGPAEVRGLSPAAGLLMVAPNTVAQFPFFEAETLSRTGAAVAAAPLYSVGRLPVDGIAEVVAGLLEGTGVRGGR